MSLNSKTVNLREAILTVVIAILCGILYEIWSAGIYPLAEGILPGYADSIYGFWFIASIIAAYIIQKPGVAFMAEFAAALFELVLGSPYGASLVVYGAVQGLFAEAVFAAFGYRSFKLPVLLLAGASAALGSFLGEYVYGGLRDLQSSVFMLKLVIRTISGALLAGLLAKLVVDALVKTGVLNNYALIRKQRSQSFEEPNYKG
jgi:energy-coupling factor transport system substrate-specific component